MNTLKKTAIAATVVAGLGCGATAQAYILGPGAEGLLVPIAGYYVPPYMAKDIADGKHPMPLLNTVAMIHTMSEAGVDVISEAFLSQHVYAALKKDGKTAADLYRRTCNVSADGNVSLGKGDDDGFEFNDVPCDEIKWFFFDWTSKHVLDGTIPVTPDDKFTFNMAEVAKRANVLKTLNGVTGYLVFVTMAGFEGKDANFIMAADAFLSLGEATTEIPVLGLADGADTPAGLSNSNNCVRDGRWVDCSPIISGTRLTTGDGVPNNTEVLVDVEIFPRSYYWKHHRNPYYQNVFVSWLDNNYGWEVPIDVFDDSEKALSWIIPMPYELNALVVVPDGKAPSCPKEPGSSDKANIHYIWCWLDGSIDFTTLPEPGYPRDFGFVRMYLPEGKDTGPNKGATSAGAFFNMVLVADFGPVCNSYTDCAAADVKEPTVVDHQVSMFTLLGHDVGKLVYGAAPSAD